MRIFLISNNKEEKVSSAYSASHKKGYSKKSRELRTKVDMYKIQCYQCHKIDHYRSDCPYNPKNNKRGKDQTNVGEEGCPKKTKPKELDIRDLHY